VYRRTTILSGWGSNSTHQEEVLDVSVYKVVEIIGTSNESWENAALSAVKKARETIRQLRVAEVVEQDLDLDESGGVTFRTKLRLSFKYEDEQ
jgi:flavin-binding protein dodecin